MTFVPNATAPATPRAARELLLDVLEYELLGPESPDEFLDESPLSRYLVGMLAPFGTDVAPEEQEDSPGEDDGEDLAGAPELAPPLSQALSPSSIGLSCLLRPGTARLRAAVTWGEYERIPSDEPEAEAEVDDADLERDASGDDASSEQPARVRRRRRRERWQRFARMPAPVEFDLSPDGGLQRERVLPDDEVWVEHVSRRLDDGQQAVSVFLVNRRSRPIRGRPPADTWLFQPTLAVTDLSEANVFLPRELEPEIARTDRDLEANALLYRNRREFAVGHGCAVEWTASGTESASRVLTTLIPSFELPRTDPRAIPDASLDMATLGEDVEPSVLARRLTPIADAYEEWIDRKTGEAARLPESLQSTAEDHLRHCRETLARLRDGIDLLASNDRARAAFAFANRAMLLQRSHTEWSETRRHDAASSPSAPELAGAWRPFQVAFILLNLRGIIDPAHRDRTIGDLLWFPTGGGKTEAYLGLAAFAMAARRLRDDDPLRTDAGVTVLMRYTLRLLTIQQFQRASTLLCACEVLRDRENGRWGTRRFSIGLWLGRQSTPNRHDESRLALDRLSKGEPVDEANPCQLESCPWCGEALSHDDYEADGDRRRTTVTCPRRECDFSEGRLGELPVLLVDEEIYRECPSMLIATVDKFAQMPWNGEVAAIFGNVDRECARCGFLAPDSEHPATHRDGGRRASSAQLVGETGRLAPPELIIQDELHLIAGPLGTMVGLYETAVDALCTRHVGGAAVRPKVIASTATIRRAFEQVQALFA